jgi:hypothetical protein
VQASAAHPTDASLPVGILREFFWGVKEASESESDTVVDDNDDGSTEMNQVQADDPAAGVKQLENAVTTGLFPPGTCREMCSSTLARPRDRST